MDHFHMSIPLTGQLFSKNITCIRTNSNRKGLPKKIKETKGREENRWMSYKNDASEDTLNSYIEKIKSSGM